MRRTLLVVCIALISGCETQSGALLQRPATFALPPTTASETEQIRQTAAVMPAIVRVVCAKGGAGTGWFHASGRVVTAAHVVEHCAAATDVKVFVVNPDRNRDRPVNVTAKEADADLDLALLTVEDVSVKGLDVGVRKELRYGDVVVTWGYPGGYVGLLPLLTVGHVAGAAPTGLPPKGGGPPPRPRVFVNAAFNKGNSGGPLIDVETRTVVGVVHAKLVPMNPTAESALKYLAQQRSGFVVQGKDASGREVRFTEAQVTAIFLEHLYNQVQLVVGTSVMVPDLRAFLERHGVTP